VHRTDAIKVVVVQRAELHSFLSEAFVEHGPALRRYVTRIAGADLAEDVVQETMLRAWKNVEKLHEHAVGGHVWHWLAKVARNVVIDAARARKCRPAEVMDTDPPADRDPRGWVPDPSAELVATLACSALLGPLTPAQRSVVVEVYFAGHTVMDTAELLHMPLGTVKSRLNQGLKRLRQQTSIDEMRQSA
jgi:RNA polymerase sigma-70 factor (ECF subfamily)